MLEDTLLVDVTFGLLTPGYTFERVDLSMLIPQALPEAVDLLQTCRQPDRRDLFPELVEVRPQPATGWGLFLALPTWVQEGIVVCLDLSSIDGRVFAERVPRHVDLWTILSLADLPFDTDVEVHVPDFNGPLPRGADCEVYMGCCIMFLPPGVPPVYLDLMRMLRSPEEWSADPGLEHVRVDNGYCVAAAAEYFLFRLLPERSMYYRQDIAASAHIHHSRLQIVPAAAQPQDVLIAGWTVKAVLAAVPTRVAVSWAQENENLVTGLLDARPALLGWMPLQTSHDWLDLVPLAASLLQSAPPGFQVVFPAFPRHWSWIWFTQGQILTVAFVQEPTHATVAREPLQWSPDDQNLGPQGEDQDEAHDVGSSQSTQSGIDANEVVLREPRRGVERASVPPHMHDSPPRPTTTDSPAPSPHDAVHLGVKTPTKIASRSAELSDMLLLGVCLLWQHVPCYYALLLGCVLWSNANWIPQVHFGRSARMPRLIYGVIFMACLLQQPLMAHGMDVPVAGSVKPPLAARGRPLPTPARSLLSRGIPCQRSLASRAADTLRSLPTPCCLDGPVTASSHTVHSSGPRLITLLEESVASPQSTAFFMAATLLDTLVEHFSHPEPCSLPTGDPGELRLLEHLPPPKYAIDQDSVRMPHDQGTLRRIFQPWPRDWLVQPKWRLPGLPASTSAALDDTLPWDALFHADSMDTVSFSIFTDGSANHRKHGSGYAAVTLAHTSMATSLVGRLAGQIDGNSASPWPSVGPPALHAEHVAIVVAVLWSLQMRGALGTLRCTIFFDCTAAGWSAEGSWPTSERIGHFAHQLAMTARATPGLTLDFQHVKGHSNHPWNDLADFAAKSASRGQQWPEPPYPLCHDLYRQDLSWLAVEQDARNHHAVPLLDGALVWTTDPDNHVTISPEQLVPTVGSSIATANSAAKPCEACIATINIQSLKGKGKYVEEQLEARGVNLAFLQETKLSSGAITSQHYLRLHTHANSHWGVAIWVHRQRGLLSIDGCPLHVDEHDIAVLHEDPRLLALLVTVGEVKIGLLSGHCPHATKPTDRDAFLAELGPLLKRLKHVHLVLGGIDLNGRIPCGFQDVSGNLEFGEPDVTGWKAAALFAETGIWIPSMFPQLHCGDSVTYYHPNGQPHRIDYVLLGGRAVVVRACSEVDITFDNGSPQEDHKLLKLELQGFLDATASSKRLHRVKYDRDRLMAPEGREVLKRAFDSFPQPSWHTSPDHHCHALEEHLRSVLDANFSMPQTTKRASYIPDKVWQLRDRKLSFKKRVRHRAGLWDALLSRAFLQWKEDQDYGVATLLAKQNLLYEVAATAVRLITSVIRKIILRAKNAFLQKVAEEGHQGAAKILQRVKRAGLGGAKSRPISRPLPLLLHPTDGSAVTTRQQRDQVWMLHFGRQEQGQAMPVVDFLQEASRTCCDPTVVWTADLLPAYSDIEAVFRDIPRNKSAGIDKIPGEIFRAAPPEAARAVFPLFLKSMLWQHQPVQWRGGILYEAFKRSGLQSAVENYRSLFVSNYLGKAYHRVVRNKTQAQCRDEFHPLHLGSRKQAPVTFAALFVLSHLRRSHRYGHSASVLFLDTSAAYYRIVRELAVGDIRCDDTVVRLFQRFGLDADDMNELTATVAEGGMLAKAGAPDALRQVVKDIHLSTWFVSRFSDGSQVCSSMAGSRPGESWADLIYAFVYSRVLWKVHEFAVAEDLTFSIPYDAEQGVFAADQGMQSLNVTDTTWADDSAFPLEDACPIRLLRKTRRLSTLVLSFCEGHGMMPNLKPGKTSILLKLFGPGSTTARRTFFPEGAKRLLLPDLGVGVAVMDQYKHLGGYLDCRLSMKPEARYRLAQASSAYDSAKTLLLGSPRLELATRASLFETAVTPTFFNVGMWIPEGPAWDMLTSGYSKILRRLMVPVVGAHKAFRIPLPIVHWCTGCWRLELVAKRARFSLLLSLTQAGPPLLWAMLQDERTWFDTLQADIRWFIQQDEANWPAAQVLSWPQWHGVLRSSPQRVRRRLRKRLDQEHKAQCSQDMTTICQWHCYRTLMERQTKAGLCTTWQCLPCRKAFASRAALSVHFFKVHGRVAAYRQVASGSMCQACDTCFWTAGRLAAHLRASPGCVRALQQMGHFVDRLAPGFGSKKRRQEDSRDYTLSMPLRKGSIPQAPAVPYWGLEHTAVYRELCDLLQTVPASMTEDKLLHEILCILCRDPLYQDEINRTVDLLQEEVHQLHAADPQDPWDADTASRVLRALGRVQPTLWAEHETDDTRHGLQHSLRDFQSSLQAFDWMSAVSSLCLSDGTRPTVTIELLSSWEAEWRQQGSQVGISAVIDDYGILLPEKLRRAWECLLEGCTVRLRAPPDFWSHPVAAPFICAREDSFARSN